MRKTLKNNKGFSLVETTLAMIIVVIALLTGLSTFQTGVSASMSMEKKAIAAQLANEKLEIILADNKFRGFDYISNANNYPVEDFSEGYTREVYVTEVDINDLSTPQPGSGINKVDVVVSWSATENAHVTLSTLVADVE